MESEDNFSDTVIKPRSALTDMTNRPLKRQLSSISGDDVGVENLLKKKCHREDKGKSLCVELPLSGNNSSQEPSLPSGGTDDSNDSYVGFSQKSQGGSQSYDFVDRGFERDDRGNCVVDDLGLNKCAGGVVEPSIVSGSNFPGLERCAGLKGHGGGANSDAHVGGDVSVELLKNCTCSFCSKAAYIWSDLHYQDVKGRLTALRKSQKDARLVVQKVSGINDTRTIINVQQGATDPSDLESTLMHQWKSLFVYMENILGHESRQLESSFEKLKDLRENCKNDLESTTNSSSGNH
ncbi:uncharacterized protein LOC131603213 [Vicia villosa]|uniref:uncharacterized protein LOC131603213 n=1 Tax=Vicia villosa TaxID=3911 RepID=UPI00273C5E9C|nr:uncharacterized protein LOC131603213 [Vicia villosa]XP_058731479.1 uncharacterized protein LOC131603213 [Vicia villosa]XP_058731480.1 uncharacterized protein LOC131603213 [Vicia villosa]XP_058731481.1 uncharacterized protein LOC131603213 [Vicia villosa]